MSLPERVSLIFLVALVSAGCNGVNRARECRRLARTVNTALGEVEGLQRTSPNDPATLRRVAARYDELVHELNGLSFSEESTRRDVADYAGLFLGTAKSVRMAADGLERNDSATVARARGDLERVRLREKLYAVKVGNACSAHR